MGKTVIQQNSPEENLILPLYFKKLYMDIYPDLLLDKGMKQLFSDIEYDFSKKYPMGIKQPNAKLSAVESGLRSYDVACEIKKYLEKHPRACVVNLCCGLDTTYTIADNGNCRVYNVDSKENIDIRNQLIPESNRVTNIVGSMNETEWFKQIIWKKEHGIIFYGLNCFYYYKKEDVKTLFKNLAENFEGGEICFDACIRAGLANMMNGVSEVDTYFSLDNPEEELSAWSNRFNKIKTNGVFTGYRKMDRRYGLKIRMIGKAGDQAKMSQINTIEFK